jgi:hypothetical protein
MPVLRQPEPDKAQQILRELFAGDDSPSRRLCVAHPRHGVCRYCDDLYHRIRAAFKLELHEEIAAEVREDHFNEAADLVDSHAWPHEKPESENEALYRLANQIREAGRND